MNNRKLIDAVLDDLSRTLHQVDPAEIDRLQNALLKARRIFVAGKGRTGLQMRAFAMRLMQLGLHVHIVDDVTTPSIQRGDLLLIGSASGRTASLVRYAESMPSIGALVGTIVGDPTSPIAASADYMVTIPAGNFKSAARSGSKSVLLMGSLFEHSLGLVSDLIIIHLKAALNVSEDEMNSRHANLE